MDAWKEMLITKLSLHTLLLQKMNSKNRTPQPYLILSVKEMMALKLMYLWILPDTMASLSIVIGLSLYGLELYRKESLHPLTLLEPSALPCHPIILLLRSKIDPKFDIICNKILYLNLID